jgi:hypothetical protein
MPESIVREQLEAMVVRVQGVVQLRSGLCDQDATQNRPPTPHFVVWVARGPDVHKVRSLSELCCLRVSVETYMAQLQCKRCQRFGHTQRNCGYTPRCVACGESHPSGECSTPRQQLKCCSCGGNHTANYRCCAKSKVAKAALAMRTPTPRNRSLSFIASGPLWAFCRAEELRTRMVPCRARGPSSEVHHHMSTRTHSQAGRGSYSGQSD